MITKPYVSSLWINKYFSNSLKQNKATGRLRHRSWLYSAFALQYMSYVLFISSVQHLQLIYIMLSEMLRTSQCQKLPTRRKHVLLSEPTSTRYQFVKVIASESGWARLSFWKAFRNVWGDHSFPILGILPIKLIIRWLQY